MSLPISDCQLPICPTNFSCRRVGYRAPVASAFVEGACDKLKVRRTFEQIGNWQSEIGNDSIRWFFHRLQYFQLTFCKGAALKIDHQ
jgi:hypothetical protein